MVCGVVRPRGALVIATLVSVAAPITTPDVGATAAAQAEGYETWRYYDGWQRALACPQQPPTERWQLDVHNDASYAFDDDGLIVADRSPGVLTVRRVDLATGAELWSTELSAQSEISYGDLHVRDGVAVVQVREDGEGSRHLTVLDIADGGTLFSARGGASPFPHRAGDLVLLADSEYTIAIDARTGEERWRVDESLANWNGTVIFTLKPPGDDGYSFGVFDLDEVEQRWEHERPESGSSVYAVEKTVLLFTTNAITAFDVSSGEERWEQTELDVGDYPSVFPVAADALLIEDGEFGTGLGLVAVLDRQTGAIRWQRDIANSSLARTWRVDGRQVVLIEEPETSQAAIVDESGEVVVDSAVVIDDTSGICDGLIFSQHGTSVEALDLATLEPRWTATVGSDAELRATISGGFVTEVEQADGRVTLVGYLASGT